MTSQSLDHGTSFHTIDVESELESGVRRAAVGMVALGLLHAIPAWSVWLYTLIRSFRHVPFSIDDWSMVARLETPREIVWLLWPPLLGLLAIARPWRELRPAMVFTAVTLLALDLGLALLGFRLGRLEWPGWLARITHRWPPGHSLLMLIFAAACVLWLVQDAQGRQVRRLLVRFMGRGASGSRREAVAGRMALVGALLFAGAGLTGAGWVVFERVGLQWSWLRDQLGPPVVGSWARGRGAEPISPYLREGLGSLQAGMQLWHSGEYESARRRYIRGLGIVEEMMATDSQAVGRHRGALALGLNNLAWLLAMCPDESLRDLPRAVAFAKRSITLVPDDGNTWNTLGAALYRGGDGDEARTALEKSIELKKGGSPHDWFLMALIEEREGNHEKAMTWFDRATAGLESMTTPDRDLGWLHAEAAEALGVPSPKP